jgi:hypothetical protein
MILAALRHGPIVYDLLRPIRPRSLPESPHGGLAAHTYRRTTRLGVANRLW